MPIDAATHFLATTSSALLIGIDVHGDRMLQLFLEIFLRPFHLQEEHGRDQGFGYRDG